MSASSDEAESSDGPSSPSIPAPPKENLARSAGLVGLATMASRLLGLLREQVFLISFGPGPMDAYNVAFRLPNLVRDLFAEGAMSAAFVPTFMRELHQRGRDAAWQLGRVVISGLVVAAGAVAVMGIVFAEPLTRFVAGGFAQVPGKLELTTTLTQVMFPFLTLVAVAVACMGMLNATRRFFLPALAPAMFNVASILSVFLVVPLMPMFGWDPMVGLAIGTLLGGAGQIAIQWPALRREGFHFRFQFAPRDPRFREVAALMIPGTVGLAAVQVNQLVNLYLSTHEGEGAVSYLTFAFRLMYLPIGLFGVTIATAVLPSIARHAAADDTPAIRDDLSHALRMMLMLNVPATFGLMALAVPITELLVEYGRRMTSANTLGVAAALMGYAPGLVGYSAVKIASPTFYALRDSRTPVAVSVSSIALNIVLNVMLVRTMSYPGLALGTGLAALFNAGALLWLLRRRLGGLDDRRVLVSLGKVMVASLVMAAAAWGVEHALSIAWPTSQVMARLARVSLSVGSGLLTLALMARVLRLREFEAAFGRVMSKLFRRR